MAKIKVAVYGTTGRVVEFDPKASVGATIGTDLLMPDGTVATLAKLAAAIGSGSTTPVGSTGAIAHSSLAGLALGDDHPQYLRKDTLTTDGDMYVRTSGVPARFGIGANHTVLTSNGSLPAWADISGNPTAHVGLSAVNGTANTFMRSDGAPALDQGIAPHWTAQHTFDDVPLVGVVKVVLESRAVNTSTGLLGGGDLTADRTLSVDDSHWATVAFTGDYSDLSGTPPYLGNLTYLTEDDETSVLVNSRQVLAGTNISFDDTTPGQRTINASGGGGSSPLTTKGDIWGYDTVDARVPVGADGDVLTADSGAALGVSWQPASGGATGADPTAAVGLTAVNGTALTFLRSDGAPPLDHGIAPTWTGNHTFSPGSGVGILINLVTGQYGLRIVGDGNSQYMMQLNSTSATGGRNAIQFLNSGAVNQHWVLGVDPGGSSNGTFSLRNVTGGTNPIQVTADGHITIDTPTPTSTPTLTVNVAATRTGLRIALADSASLGVSIADGGANNTELRLSTTNSAVNVQSIGTAAVDLRFLIGASTAVTINGTTRQVSVSTPTTGPALTLPAGTTSVYPMKLTFGTNLTTPAAGAVEFDGTVKYFSPIASTRGLDLIEYFVCLNATYTLTSQTAAQKLFNATTNGALTLPVATYEFECYYFLTSMSGSSGAFGFALGGSAAFTFEYMAQADKGTSPGSASTSATTSRSTAANTAISPTNTATSGWARITGIIRVTSQGTVIPQVSLDVAAAAVVGKNSYFRCRPLGSGTVTNVGNWS